MTQWSIHIYTSINSSYYNILCTVVN